MLAALLFWCSSLSDVPFILTGLAFLRRVPLKLGALIKSKCFRFLLEESKVEMFFASRVEMFFASFEGFQSRNVVRFLF